MWSVSHIVVVIILKSMLKVNLLRGMWQVPYSSKGLVGLMHINKLDGRGWVTLQQYQVYFNMK